MNRFAPLFAPIQIGQVKVPNRIVMAPMSTQYAGPDGSVTERMVRYYEERARGGTGLVIVEFAYVDNLASRAEWAQLACHSDTHLPGLSDLAERINVHGSVSCLQLAHAGCQKLHITPPLKAPSAIPWNEQMPVPEELTIAEIDGILTAFAQATLRAKRAGFDMVELHAAHGYLLTEFLSSTWNQRTDKYGGTVDNRQRFLLEMLVRCRELVGPDYPIGVRVSAVDYSGGFSLDDTILLCQRLQELGAAYIHVSSGTYRQREMRITPLYYYPLGNFVDLAAAIKQSVSIPVIASGSILDPDMALDTVASGKADMVAMARQLFADPEWGNKVKDGRLDEIIRCIRCNEGCLLRLIKGKSVRCWVNPSTGNEAEFALRPALRRRRVLVVGGGPAGLEAAFAASARGHEVTLMEAGSRLGGQLIPASVPWFKKDLVPLRERLVRQVEKAPITVHLGAAVTAAGIQSLEPDVIILATGARPVWPDISRPDGHPQMVNAFEVVNGDVTVGDRVVVVGGGLIGAETAWYLAEAGKQVTVTSRQQMIGHDLLPDFRKILLQHYALHNVRQMPNVKLDAVTSAGAVFIDRNWERHAVDADTLVLASGMTSQLQPLEGLNRAVYEIYIIGDARRPRNIGDAIYEGAYLARLI